MIFFSTSELLNCISMFSNDNDKYISILFVCFFLQYFLHSGTRGKAFAGCIVLNANGILEMYTKKKV